MTPPYTSIGTTVDDHAYVFRFTDEAREQLPNAVMRFIFDPEFSFGPADFCRMMQKAAKVDEL